VHGDKSREKKKRGEEALDGKGSRLVSASGGNKTDKKQGSAAIPELWKGDKKDENVE